jgi:N-acetyl-anhydromuramyl-L-alanine amidase AmpD
MKKIMLFIFVFFVLSISLVVADDDEFITCPNDNPFATGVQGTIENDLISSIVLICDSTYSDLVGDESGEQIQQLCSEGQYLTGIMINSDLSSLLLLCNQDSAGIIGSAFPPPTVLFSCSGSKVIRGVNKNIFTSSDTNILLCDNPIIPPKVKPAQPAVSGGGYSNGGSSAQYETITKTVDKIVPGCNSQKRCKDVDQVWEKVGQKVRSSNQVWDTSKMKWGLFNDIYKEIITEKKLISSGGSDSSSSTDSQVTYSGTPPVLITDGAWKSYQQNIMSNPSGPGKSGGETFSGASKTVTVEKPNFNGQQASGSWSVTINPSQTCAVDNCQNEIVLKSKKIDQKLGVVIHATDGNTAKNIAASWKNKFFSPYDCHTKSVNEWNNKYATQCGGAWPYSNEDGTQPLAENVQKQKCACAKDIKSKEKNAGCRLSIQSCQKLGGGVHYILSRDGKVYQHASEYSALGHTANYATDSIPPAQRDPFTIGIEVANTISKCKSDKCKTPISLWNNINNYQPQSDFLSPGSGKYGLSKNTFNNKKLEVYSDDQIKGLVKLTAEIMIRHDISLGNLIRHYDNTRRGKGTHWDPSFNFDWMGFRKSVCQAINGYKNTNVPCGNEQVACYGCGTVTTASS